MAATVPEHFYAGLQEAGVSVEEATKYYASFKIFDKDGSDTMDAGELYSCLQVLGQTPKTKDEVDDMLKEYDKDSSGKLDFMEFAKMMGQVCKPTHSVRDDLVTSFQVFDKDHSGFLDRQELHDAIFSMGNVSLTEKEFDKLMKAADTSGDGKIDYAEFAALLLADISKMIESSQQKLANKQQKDGKHGDNKDHHGDKKDKENKDHHGEKKDKHRHRSRKHSGGSGSNKSHGSRSRSSSGGSGHSKRSGHSSRSGHSKRSGKSH